MYRKFIATIAATSITITALSALPARADQEDVARALAALVGIAIIGKIISDSKDDDVVTRRYPSYPDPVYRPHRPRRVDPAPIYPRPLPRRVHRRELPQHCFRSYDTPQGRFHMFGRKCLRKNYHFVNSLPQQCAQRIRTYHGIRNGFSARCLRRAGYRLRHG